MLDILVGPRRRAPEILPTAMLAIAILAWLTLGPAFAQETPPVEDNTVGIGWIVNVAWPWVENGIGMLVALLVGWAASLYTRVSGRQLEQQHRDALNAALKTGALNVLGGVKGRLEDLRFEVKNDLIRKILRYAEESVPDALAWLKPSPEVIEAKANAALTEAAAQVGKTAPAAPAPAA